MELQIRAKYEENIQNGEKVDKEQKISKTVSRTIKTSLEDIKPAFVQKKKLLAFCLSNENVSEHLEKKISKSFQIKFIISV